MVFYVLQLRKSKQYCGICKKIWHHSDGGNWVRFFFVLISVFDSLAGKLEQTKNLSLRDIVIGVLRWL